MKKIILVLALTFFSFWGGLALAQDTTNYLDALNQPDPYKEAARDLEEPGDKVFNRDMNDVIKDVDGDRTFDEDIDSTTTRGTPPSFITGKKGLLPTSGEETGEGFRSYIVTKLIPGFANVAITILWSISTIFIIIAGVIYVFSSGESEMIKKAKDIILWTIVGTCLATLSYAVVKLLTQTDFALS